LRGGARERSLSFIFVLITINSGSARPYHVNF
jgi:hypothetical protein